MRLPTLFIAATVALAGCTSQQAYNPRCPSGIVQADGTIVWDQPAEYTGPSVQQVVSTALEAAGDYYRGRAEGYQSYQAQHGSGMVITPGQPTSFIFY